MAGKNLPWSHWGKITCRLHLELVTRCITILFTALVLSFAICSRIKKLIYISLCLALRMNVRSSLYNKTTAASHEHEFGPETFNEEDDNYNHTCKTCGYEETFEKM